MVCDAGTPAELGSIPEYARVFGIRICRPISPFSDLSAFIRLYFLFRRERYVAATSVTPKAGMLTMLAARVAKVPVRIHVFTGQVWVTRTGWKRQLLKGADRLIAHFATHVLVDSPSQRNFIVGEGIVEEEKTRVLGEGSICGVDGERFRPDSSRRTDVRRALGIPEETIVFLFIGRLNRDKGIIDLVDAFASLGLENAWLLIVGPDEGGLRAEAEHRLGVALARTRFVGYTDRPEEFMAAADVFCLPSYREGFGMVIIEAAAAGIPAIGARIYGITDAIEENVTGLLHRPGDVAELADLMALLAGDAESRRTLGEAARGRALRLFSREAVTKAWLDFYRQLLG